MHDNLRNLGLDALEVVNLRSMFSVHGPAEGSIEAPLTVVAELQRQGLVRHIGLSNVTPAQIAEGRKICDIVCVQNQYNVAQRADDALIDQLARDGVPYVPFFPLGGFTPLQSSVLSDVARRLGATPMQVALAWLLARAPNILLIPGTSSLAHLRENLAAVDLALPDDARAALDDVAGAPPPDGAPPQSFFAPSKIQVRMRSRSQVDNCFLPCGIRMSSETRQSSSRIRLLESAIARHDHRAELGALHHRFRRTSPRTRSSRRLRRRADDRRRT